MAAQEKFDLVVRAHDEATATIRRVNGEVDKLATGGVPRLTSSMSSYSREAIRADLKSAALGSRLAGLSPAVGQLSNAFMIGNPLVAAAAFGIGLLSSEIVDAITAHQQAMTAITNHRTALESLANSNDRYAESARQLLEIRRQLAEKELSAAQGSLVLAQNGMRAATFMERLIGLGPLVSASQDDITKASAEAAARIAELRKELGTLSNQMYGPTRDDMERFISQEKQAARDAEMLNKALRERATLMGRLRQGDFRGLGADASLRGPDYFGVPQDEVDKAKKEAQDAMGRIWAIPEEETRMLEDAQARWMEFSGMVLSSTDQLATGITDMFFGLRDSLADVFKSMAMNWVRYFINEIIKQTALKLGFALFNTIFPGSGSVLGAAGASDVGVLPGLARVGAGGGTGVDIVSAGAKRFSSGGSGPASVTIQFNAPIIGDEQFVREKIAPEIERLARFQLTRIQVA